MTSCSLYFIFISVDFLYTVHSLYLCLYLFTHSTYILQVLISFFRNYYFCLVLFSTANKCILLFLIPSLFYLYLHPFLHCTHPPSLLVPPIVPNHSTLFSYATCSKIIPCATIPGHFPSPAPPLIPPFLL